MASRRPHDLVAPLADLLITHAGHGTGTAAAGAGTPVLCLPMGREEGCRLRRISGSILWMARPPRARPVLTGANPSASSRVVHVIDNVLVP